MSPKKTNPAIDVDIGFDPLAWMSDEESNQLSEEVTEPAIEKSTAEAATTEEPSIEVETEVVATDELPEAVEAIPKTANTTSESYRIELAGKLDIASATELKLELSDALNQGGAIIFAAADVSRADGAGLQLLASFARELDGSNRELSWEEPSEQLISAANIIGMKEVLHLP